MPAKEPLLPLNWGILEGFKFVDGPGECYDRTVCIMTAAYLVTQIAKGKVTLETAVMSDAEWAAYYDRNSNEEGEGPARYHHADKVACVSDVLRDICVKRNDSGAQTEDERKEWAMKLLPRIVDTAFGRQTDRRARLAASEVDRNFRAPRAAELKNLLEAETDAGKRFNLRSRIERLENGEDPWDEDAIVCYDLQIAAMLPIFERARAGREKRLAALRLTLAEKKQKA